MLIILTDMGSGAGGQQGASGHCATADRRQRKRKGGNCVSRQQVRKFTDVVKRTCRE